VGGSRGRRLGATVIARARRADIAYVASIAVSAIVLVVLGVAQLRRDMFGVDDFTLYVSGSRALLLGADPYDAATWADTAVRVGTVAFDTVIYAYPPWSALALVPFALLPVYVADALWSVIGVTAAALAVRALLRAYLPGRAWAHGVVGSLVLMSAPAVVTLLTGQWPFVFVAMLAAIVLLLRAGRPVAAGLVAPMMLVKPQLFVFTVTALAVRALWPGSDVAGRRFVITATAAGIAVVVISWVLIPTWWPTWFQLSPAVLLGIEPVTLQTLFITLFGPNGGWLAAPVLLAMVAAGLQFHPLSQGWLPVWFALSSAGVVYSNTYDVLLLIVPIVLAAGALASRRRAVFVIISGFGLLFFVMWYLHTIYARGYAAGVSLLVFVIITAALWPQRREIGAQSATSRRASSAPRT
jgi:alpha-1,2-mannosyltransferase